MDCSTNFKPFYSSTLLVNSPETDKGPSMMSDG